MAPVTKSSIPMEDSIHIDDNYFALDLDKREINASSTPLKDEEELFMYSANSKDLTTSTDNILVPTPDSGPVRPLIDVFTSMAISADISPNSTPEDLVILSEWDCEAIQDMAEVCCYDPEDELSDMNDVFEDERNIIKELSFRSDEDSFLENEFKCEDLATSNDNIHVPMLDSGAVRPLIDAFTSMAISADVSPNSTPEDLAILFECDSESVNDTAEVSCYDPEDELSDMNDVIEDGRNITKEISFMSDQDSFLENEFKCELECAKDIIQSDLASNWTPPKNQRMSPMKPPGSPSSPKEKKLYDRWESAVASPRRSLKRINQEWKVNTNRLTEKRQVRIRWGPDEQITVETPRWHKDLTEARIGPWLDMAWAREEFEYRVMDAEYVLGPVLSLGHREKVYMRKISQRSGDADKKQDEPESSANQSAGIPLLSSL
ncbi:unnamed protein product [Meganyctiphanes norvegica]|uniref:Uncharacterized protein n=1 Tax=Meganyctiphanes norvegica TaxID=48144 RepID=A0AAV2RFB1_MEGNR